MFKISEPMWGSFLFDRLTRTEVESFCDCQMNKQNKTDKKNIKWRQRQQMWVHIMHLFKVLVWQEPKLPRHARRSLIFGWIIIMYFGFFKDASYIHMILRIHMDILKYILYPLLFKWNSPWLLHSHMNSEQHKILINRWEEEQTIRMVYFVHEFTRARNAITIDSLVI